MKQITMMDVAKKAGVCRSTVSEILNDKTNFVSQKTRERVLKVARDLNYRPNYFAKSIRMGKTSCIGLMGSMTFANLSIPYFAHLAAAVEESLAEATDEYSLNIFGARYTPTYEKSVELIKKGLVDGLIFIILAEDLKKFHNLLQPILDDLRLPFVVLHSTRKELPYNNVGIDSFHGGYLAGEHLVNLSHKDIWVYEDQHDSPQAQEILDGFKKSLADKGVEWDTGKTLGAPSTEGFYQSAIRSMLGLKEVPPALFVPHEEAAAGCLHGLEQRGVRVPEDTAIVSFNEAEPTPFFIDVLTSVRHPMQEKARAGVNMLLDLLAGRRDKDQVHSQTIKPWLEVKQSCGAKKQIGS